MIPKKIHYCWFGGNPLPELTLKCIESWKKYCPDYEIIEWNESNFDVNCRQYTKEAYQAKKWAFVSDVARLYALVNHGGIYMDTDVEVLKPLDDFLKYEAFSGFESENGFTTAVMGCCKNHPMHTEFLEEYDSISFIKADKSLDTTTNVARITKTCLRHGVKIDNTLQTVNGLTLFPKDYFSPKDLVSGKLELTDNSYAIHHFDGSWLSDKDKYFVKKRYELSKIISKRMAGLLAEFIAVTKYNGIKSAIKETVKWLKK